ncbi:MAG: L-histidine N(alpha)-methyltransferase [Anaerolineales bacterium]
MSEAQAENLTVLHGYAPDNDGIRRELLDGLRKPEKSLPSKLFYDEVGSELFEQITKLDEYYLTRTETEIYTDWIDEIKGHLGSDVILIEFGSGNSQKTRILLDHLPDPAAYVPIDISQEKLTESATAVAAAYPGLNVLPIWADYTRELEFPAIGGSRKAALFPGSTIGNFYPHEAEAFLKRVAELVGEGGGLLIGVDLKKDAHILNLAYNDAKGVTAAFNLNMLEHLNREFGADFQLDQYRHQAIYNEALGRIEMYLVSLKDQRVSVGDAEFSFRREEGILTEVSHKYTVGEFERLAVAGGFHVRDVWTDGDQLFSVQCLVV